MRFVAPPNWPPTPEGWQPPPDWRPPPDWPAAPAGWQFWQEERPRPSVWSTLGIALASALVLGSALGAALGSGDDLANDMGYGFGRLLIPALLVGGLWPFVARRTSRWFIPLVVLGIGAVITVLVNAGQAAP